MSPPTASLFAPADISVLPAVLYTEWPVFKVISPAAVSASFALPVMIFILPEFCNSEFGEDIFTLPPPIFPAPLRK